MPEAIEALSKLSQNMAGAVVVALFAWQVIRRHSQLHEDTIQKIMSGFDKSLDRADQRNTATNTVLREVATELKGTQNSIHELRVAQTEHFARSKST